MSIVTTTRGAMVPPSILRPTPPRLPPPATPHDQTDSPQAANENDKTLLVDPTGAEASAATSCVTLGSMPALGQVTSMHLTGEADLGAACDVSQLLVLLLTLRR